MENEIIKVCILGATFDTGNMGVSMLAAGAIRCILHRFPLARIVLLDYAREGYEFDFPFAGKNIPIRFVNIRFSKKCYLENNVALLISLFFISKLIPCEKLRQRLLSSNKYSKEIIESDLVASIAYGDSFSDIYGIGRLLYIVCPQILALLARKRLVLLPQTIGPFRHRVSRMIARHIVKHAEAVYSRDQIGVETAGSLLGTADRDKKLRFCYDLAFDVDPVAPKVLTVDGLAEMGQDGSILVGFNVSGLLLAGGYTQNNMFGLKIGYEKLVHFLIEFLINEKSAKVLLIPHVFGSPDNIESDSHACEMMFEGLRSQYQGRIGLVRGRYDYNEIKYVIGQCEFFVGARMHACIGAISQNIPTALIAYSDKFSGVMRAIGLEGLVVDPRRMEEDEIKQMVDRIYNERGMLRGELKKRIPLVKQTIQNALSCVNGPLPDPSD